MNHRVPPGGPCRGFLPALARVTLGLAFVALLGVAGCMSAQTRGKYGEEPEKEHGTDLSEVRTIGDVTEVASGGPIQVSGVGLVTGLDGTGGPAPKSMYRDMLEDQLRKHRVENVKELLASPNHAMVMVTGLIYPGSRKGDRIDLQVTLPAGSQATSLKGGYLQECVLKNYDTTRGLNPSYEGSNKLLPGHILARGKGPIVVGFCDGDESVRDTNGRVWEGGVSLLDRPYYLVLKNDQKFARVANAVVERINQMFPDDARKQQRTEMQRRLLVLDEVTEQLNGQFTATAPAPARTEVARAVAPNTVAIQVPYRYRLNPERYLRVARLSPLRENPEVHGKYRRKLEEMLQDPKETVRAALRLEALGKESVPVLKNALENQYTLVRFAAAEALAYLGNPLSGDPLARLATDHEVLRVYCLTALTSLDESVSRIKLAELLNVPIPTLRYGAFKALRVLDERADVVQGDRLNDTIWLHRLAPRSEPMVHVLTSRRAEIALFGQEPVLLAPLKVMAGKEFIISAEPGDDRCTVSRFRYQPPDVRRRQCSFALTHVLKTMTDLGAEYEEVVELLRQLDHHKRVSTPVLVDALPQVVPVQILAAAGRGRERFADNPELMREVQRAQEDLGATPLLYARDGGGRD
jgi:hypothetical protein